MFEIKVNDFQTAIQVEHLITSSLKSVDTIVFEKYCSAAILVYVCPPVLTKSSSTITGLSFSSYLAVTPSAVQHIYIRSFWRMHIWRLVSHQIISLRRACEFLFLQWNEESWLDLGTSKRSAVHFIEPKSTNTSPHRWRHPGRCRTEIESGFLGQVCSESGILTMNRYTSSSIIYQEGKTNAIKTPTDYTFFIW